MNWYFGPREPQYGARMGDSEKDVMTPVASENGMLLNASGVRFESRLLTRERAIAQAQAILRYYEVPFCNRVKS